MPRDGIGKIPTYVKRSRALKSARSFSPKFRAAVCSFSPGNSVRAPSRLGRTSENGHHNMVDGSDTSAGTASNDAALPALPNTRNALRRGPSWVLDLTKLAVGQPQSAAAAQTPTQPPV